MPDSVKDRRAKTYRIVIGTFILVAGLLMNIFTDVSRTLVISMVISGSILIIYTIYYQIRYKETGGPVQDEWSRRINTASLANSWFVTFILILLIFWTDHLQIYSFTIDQVVALLFITMILTANLFQLYFRKKGDVE